MYIVDPWSNDLIDVYQVGDRLWCFRKPHTVQVPDGPMISIAQQFASDGYSVPWLVRWWSSRDPNQLPPAFLHDWLYRTGLYPRKYADDVFYHHMRACGIRRTQAWAKYRGVRVGGWVAWRNHRSRG